MENARSFHAVAVVDDVAAFCGNSARIAASLDLIFVVLCIVLVLS